MVNMNRQKIIKEDKYSIMIGYYNEFHQFIYHSFDDNPAIIWEDGSKEWYEDNKQYWFIENKRYNSVDEILEKYKYKIIKIKGNISQNLTDMNIDFVHIKLVWDNKNKIWYEQFIILNDSDRNEIILRYG